MPIFLNFQSLIFQEIFVQNNAKTEQKSSSNDIRHHSILKNEVLEGVEMLLDAEVCPPIDDACALEEDEDNAVDAVNMR